MQKRIVYSPKLDKLGYYCAINGVIQGKKEDLDKVMALVAKFPKCWVFSDEIYSQLTYDGIGTPASALEYPEMRDRVVAIDGFSKTYCMTGWRKPTRNQ